MNDTEKINRIEDLLNDLSLVDLNQDELKEHIMKSTLEHIFDEMWQLYCFVEDVCNAVNYWERSEQ